MSIESRGKSSELENVNLEIDCCQFQFVSGHTFSNSRIADSTIIVHRGGGCSQQIADCILSDQTAEFIGVIAPWVRHKF